MLTGLIHAYDSQPERPRGQRQCHVVRRHHQVGVHGLTPQERAREVNGVEGTEFSRQWLRRPGEDGTIWFDHLHALEQSEHRGPSGPDLKVE